jgi:hypothetical protein
MVFTTLSPYITIGGSVFANGVASISGGDHLAQVMYVSKTGASSISIYGVTSSSSAITSVTVVSGGGTGATAVLAL